MGLCIIMLKHEVMAVDEWHNKCPKDLITASLCIHIDSNKMQLYSLSVAYACPYHNPTATMGHSVHNVDISKPLAHMILREEHTSPACQWVSKVSICPLKVAYGREMNIKLSGNRSGGHSCSQHANCNLPQNLRHLWLCVV
jgi:hypothetical protein